MRRLALGLSILAVIQLGLAAGLALSGGQARSQEAEPLVDVKPEAIESLRVSSGADDQGVLLERSDDGWRLPESDGFPANKSKADGLVSNLAAIKTGLPVASSASALSRFDLEEGQVERRMVLNPGQDDSFTVLIGKSAGANSVYARRAGSQSVYEVEFASWQAETKASAWFDVSQVQTPISDVKALEFDGFRLERGEDSGWSVSGNQPDGAIDSTKIKELVAQLVQPTFDAVTKGGQPEGKPAARYTVVPKDGERVTFRYYGGDDKQATLVRDDQPWRYQVSFDQLNKAKDVAPSQFTVGDDSASGSGKASSGEAARPSGSAPSDADTAEGGSPETAQSQPDAASGDGSTQAASSESSDTSSDQ